MGWDWRFARDDTLSSAARTNTQVLCIFNTRPPPHSALWCALERLNSYDFRIHGLIRAIGLAIRSRSSRTRMLWLWLRCSCGDIEGCL